jgi:hypothetical protein
MIFLYVVLGSMPAYGNSGSGRHDVNGPPETATPDVSYYRKPLYIARASQSDVHDPALIREVQGHLKRLGFFQGDSDGVLGRDTTSAIVQFKINAGLGNGKELSSDVIALLRERVKAVTPDGRRIAQQGQLEAFVGLGRWCRSRVRVTIQASDPDTFKQDSPALEALISQTQAVLNTVCPKTSTIDLFGMVEEARVYVAVLTDSGLRVKQSLDHALSKQTLRQQALVDAQQTSPCATADPASFDEVFSCMSSARWTRGLSAGRNRFEGNIGTSSCRTIASTYIAVLNEMAGLPRDEAKKHLPSCEIFARAAQEITGESVFWERCLGYDSMAAHSHMSRCLEDFMPGYYGDAIEITQKITGCATAVTEYERGLRSANSQSQLPTDYSRPSCDVIFAMIERWTGAPAIASRCTGYDPANVAAHLEQCMGEGVPIESLRNCSEIRRVYEALLVEAHGSIPEGYTMMPCSAAEPRLARAEAERSAAIERQRAAAMEEQRRRAEIQTARQAAKERERQARRDRVQAELDRAEAQFKRVFPASDAQQEQGTTYTQEQAIEIAQQAAIALNSEAGSGYDDYSSVGPEAELPKINQRAFQGPDPQLTHEFTTDPTTFFWNTVGNQLREAGASLEQLANISKELKRHTRNLYTALEVCCSCQYRDALLEEFIVWKSAEIKNEEGMDIFKGALAGNSVDFSQIDPRRSFKRDYILEMAPEPCSPPETFEEPTVSDELNHNGSIYSRTVDWGYVPNNFHLPTPSYKHNFRVIRYRAHMQVPGRLRTADLEKFSSRSLRGSSTEYRDIAGTEKLIDQDIGFAQRQNAYVLHCYYLSNDFSEVEHKVFWFEERPKMLKPEYLNHRVSNHLLLKVKGPIESCPLTLNEANQLAGNGL